MPGADRSPPAGGSLVLTRPSNVPADVQRSFLLWLAAVAAGVVETIVHLVATPDPPSTGQVAIRFGIYALVIWLVAGLRTGRNAVRVSLAVILGGVGTLSLILEPASWLLAGNSAVEFLARADVATLLIVAVRVIHLAAVLVALVLMFSSSANAFFRRTGHRPEASPSDA